MDYASNNGTAQAQDIPVLPYQWLASGERSCSFIENSSVRRKNHVLGKGDLGSISAVWREEKELPRHLLLLPTEISYQAVPLTPGQVFLQVLATPESQHLNSLNVSWY